MHAFLGGVCCGGIISEVGAARGAASCPPSPPENLAPRWNPAPCCTAPPIPAVHTSRSRTSAMSSPPPWSWSGSQAPAQLARSWGSGATWPKTPSGTSAALTTSCTAPMGWAVLLLLGGACAWLGGWVACCTAVYSGTVAASSAGCQHVFHPPPFPPLNHSKRHTRAPTLAALRALPSSQT